MARARFGIKVPRIWKAGRRFPLVPVTILVLFVFTAIFADVIAPYPPAQISLPDRLTPPFFMDGGSMAHPLGTDLIGRDILSRIIFGARISLSVAILVILISSVIGTIVGMIAGYLGGRTDAVLMRVTDACLAFPAILIALLLAVSLGPSFGTVILALSSLSWSRYARMIRGEVVKVRQEDFIAQARIIGSSSARIILTHLFPNVVNTLIVLMTMSVGLMILVEASLSFLGAGIPPPTPSWGSMVAEGRDLFDQAFWISFFPGLAIGLVVLSGNFLGDWIRDRLDPKLRQV